MDPFVFRYFMHRNFIKNVLSKTFELIELQNRMNIVDYRQTTNGNTESGAREWGRIREERHAKILFGFNSRT